MRGDHGSAPERSGRGDDGAEPTADGSQAPDGTDADQMVIHPDELDRSFDWRGWSLVATVLIAFLVVPAFIYLYPRAPSAFGLTFWDTYLVLPMIPAVVLGLLAVWATTRP
jgi:hypothetical protein